MDLAVVGKPVLLVQLSLLFLSTFTLSASISPVMPPTHSPRHHHHPHPPTPSPTEPPVQTPAKPPTFQQPPPLPKPRRNTIPQLSKVAVQGVVYCKSCKYAGVDTLLGAKPVPGAIVRLKCKNKENELTVQFEADKKGYFFLQPSILINNFGIQECTVSLYSSPLKSCGKPSDLNGGLKGAPLKPEKTSGKKKLPYVLYSVGPFAFEPTCH